MQHVIKPKDHDTPREATQAPLLTRNDYLHKNQELI